MDDRGTDGDVVPRPRGFRAVEVGDALGRYELVDELGVGGMATVYRARDRELRREVAVKVLFPNLARQAEVVRRFHREGRAAAALAHPGILRVLDVGGGEVPGGDPPYLVLELVRGGTLRELAEAHAPLLAELVCAIGALLADAIAAVHAAGVIHRDVKPANVLVAPDGRLLLADFGVARIADDDGQLTRTGALLGTPAFMAPEQAAGDSATAASDWYALGATLYQLATGALPTSSARGALAGEPAVPAVRRVPAVGAELSRLLGELMAADAGARPAGAGEVGARLRALAALGGVEDVAADVAAFVRAPAAYQAERASTVLARVVRRAEEAVAAKQWPRALALADRAAALAPSEASVVALVARVTEGPRRRRLTRVAFAVTGLGAAVAGTAWLATRSSGARAPAGVDAAASAGAPGDARSPQPSDARGVVTPPPRLDAALADARPGRDARAPRSMVDARPLAPPMTDARPDAAVVVDAAAAPVPAEATLTIVADAWCELQIDGAPLGRLDRRRPYPVAPGQHQLSCTQGPGLPTWRAEVTVAPGERRTLRASLLAPVRVRVAARATRVLIDGAAVSLSGFEVAPGRHRVHLERDGDDLVSWVDFPRVASCTLRDSPRLDCHAGDP